MAFAFITPSFKYETSFDDETPIRMVGEFIVSELRKYTTNPLSTPTDTDKTEAAALWVKLINLGLFDEINSLLFNN